MKIRSLDAHSEKSANLFSDIPAVAELDRSRHNPGMTSASHITLLLQVDNDLLLEQVCVDAKLDAGQWRLPIADAADELIAPSAVFCGVDLNIAAGLTAWLEPRGLSTADIQSCGALGHHKSPPWHPARQATMLVHARLAHRPQPINGDVWRWASATDWLHAWQHDALLLNPFTQLLLDAQLTERTVAWEHTSMEQALSDLRVLPVRSRTLPPATHTNAFLLGDQTSGSPTVLIDPSPADERAFEDLLERLATQHIDALFLTHHHPDHHQQAPRLAQHFNCPILCSADTRERIPARFGSDYWSGIEVHTVGDSASITTWKNQPVHAHAVPGHDAGQLALMPKGRQWMIVGDLIQGVGTVVIAEPEGDMAAYFRTLQWVIDQNPAVIIPSHGQAMGTTFRIAETLRHRKQREEQVLTLHREGHAAPEMVEIIYANVDKRLWGLARMNIDCHLKKLRDEGRV